MRSSATSAPGRGGWKSRKALARRSRSRAPGGESDGRRDGVDFVDDEDDRLVRGERELAADNDGLAGEGLGFGGEVVGGEVEPERAEGGDAGERAEVRGEEADDRGS